MAILERSQITKKLTSSLTISFFVGLIIFIFLLVKQSTTLSGSSIGHASVSLGPMDILHIQKIKIGDEYQVSMSFMQGLYIYLFIILGAGALVGIFRLRKR